MKTLRRLVLGYLAAAFVSLAPAAESTANPSPSPVDAPTAPIDFLVGGTWVATLPPTKDGQSVRLEAHFTRPENHQGMRFDSTWLVGGKRKPYTSGMYAWNAAQRKLIIFYTDSSGSLTEGSVIFESGALRHDMTAIDRTGKIESVRTHLAKITDDTFSNEIFVLKDGAWTKITKVVYERQH